MTRKDYELIARALRTSETFLMVKRDQQCAHAQRAKDAEYIADALATDNPRFDKGRFLQACGVTA